VDNCACAPCPARSPTCIATTDAKLHGDDQSLCKEYE